VRKSALREATAIALRLAAALAATAPVKVGRSGSDLRRALGDLTANAAGMIAGGTIGAQVQLCFDRARGVGATFDALDRVRLTLLAEAPVYLAGAALVQFSLRICLAAQARVVAVMSFVSRQDIEAMHARINAAFAPSVDYAADHGDAGNYQAIIALHAAVTRFLADAARPLPRMVSYGFAAAMPALTLANRIYGDGSRGDELVAENRVVHPAFCPPAGVALGA
jgi:prophage DNA circulation protein